jgi:hypothetical protein
MNCPAAVGRRQAAACSREHVLRRSTASAASFRPCRRVRLYCDERSHPDSVLVRRPLRGPVAPHCTASYYLPGKGCATRANASVPEPPREKGGQTAAITPDQGAQLLLARCRTALACIAFVGAWSCISAWLGAGPSTPFGSLTLAASQPPSTAAVCPPAAIAGPGGAPQSHSLKV